MWVGVVMRKVSVMGPHRPCEMKKDGVDGKEFFHDCGAKNDDHLLVVVHLIAGEDRPPSRRLP